MNKTALIQVLGAVAYGELKAYEGAKAEAEAATDPALRRRHRTVAAEELRHHKGFVSRLEAMGADPERAMKPYREALDRYHARQVQDPVEEAVVGFLGEGVADDLLQWLKTVVDDETAVFIDGVIADEVGHEAAAAQDLREALEATPDGKQRARRARRGECCCTCSGVAVRVPRRWSHSCASGGPMRCCGSCWLVMPGAWPASASGPSGCPYRRRCCDAPRKRANQA